MPSFGELCEKIDHLRGKMHPEERCTPLVFPRLEAKKRVKNTEGRTRLVVQLDTPATYSEFSAQFARYKELTGNPQVAYGIMLDVLKALPDESIRKMSEGD